MIELNVPDMTCDHCAKTIRNAVGRVDPAAACDIDLGAKRVKVESALPPSDFVEALEDVGYSAVVSRAVG
jgi:copper chaperone